MPEKNINWVPLVVILLSVIVQLGALFYLFDPSIYFYKYWELALRLRCVLFPPIEVFYSSPFYIGFLAISQIMGLNYLNIQIVQVLLGAFNCWLIYRAGILFFNRPVGITASLAVVFYGPFIIYNSSFIPAVWVITFNLIFLIALGKYARERKPIWLIMAGLFIGLSIISRPNIVIFLFLLIPGLFLRECLKWLKLKVVASPGIEGGESQVRRTTLGTSNLRHFFSLIIPVALIVISVAGFNYLRSGEFIPVTASGGWVFYCGNNERGKGFDFSPPPELNRRISSYYAREGGEKLSYLEHILSREIAEKRTGIHLSHREAGSFWFKEGIAFIREHPVLYLELLGKKTLSALNAYEPHDVPEVMARAALLNSYPLLWFSIVFPLALLGFIIARPRTGGIMLYLYLLSYLISFLLIYVIPRFRLPVVPVLLLFSSSAVLKLYNQIREREWPRLIRNLLFLIPLVILVNLTTADIKRDREIVRPAFFYEWKGLTSLKRGEWQKAAEEFTIALKLNPRSYQAGRGLELIKRREEEECLKKLKVPF